MSSDKAAHALLFFGVTILAYFACSALRFPLPLLSACMAAAAAGLAKEWLDPRFGGNREWGDLLANALGIAAAALLIRAWV